MLGVIVPVTIRAGSESDFEVAFGKMVAAVNANEAGCILYDLFKNSDGKYTIMEAYEDEAAFDVHRNSAHMKEIRPSYAQYIEQSELQILKSV